MIHHGDCLVVLQTLPSESVQCCVTSPPYWNLRDYGVPGQIGLEETMGEYIEKLTAVFLEVRRVLKPDGVLWLNLGDSYAAGTRGSSGKGEKQITNAGTLLADRRSSIPAGLKPKDLCGIPWRVAFALQESGWWLRSDVIWCKGNPMPESVKDRPTRAHEYVFLMTKSERYFYDMEAVREPVAESTPGRYNRNRSDDHKWADGGPGNQTIAKGFEHMRKQDGHGRRHAGFNEREFGQSNPRDFRNLRSWWRINPEPMSEGTSRRVRVKVDGLCDGSERIMSPDCPVHGDFSGAVSSVSCGEPRADSQTRSGHIDSRLDLELSGVIAPTGQMFDSCSPLDSSGCSDQSSSDAAIGHSRQTSKTVRAPETTQPYTPSGEILSDTGHTSVELCSDDSAARKSENNTAADCASDVKDLDPLAQNQHRTEGICTCEHYITKTEKTSHFATFPIRLAERCILAGSKPGDTVLDPFAGAGTTWLACLKHGREFVGIELNEEYIHIAEERARKHYSLLVNA